MSHEDVATRLAVHEAVCAERQAAIIKRLDFLTWMTGAIVGYLLIGESSIGELLKAFILRTPG